MYYMQSQGQGLLFFFLGALHYLHKGRKKWNTDRKSEAFHRIPFSNPQYLIYLYIFLESCVSHSVPDGNGSRDQNSSSKKVK